MSAAYRREDWAARAFRRFEPGEIVTIADSPYIPGGQPLPGTFRVVRLDFDPAHPRWCADAVLEPAEHARLGSEIHISVARLERVVS
jgi:hypothetical protein